MGKPASQGPLDHDRRSFSRLISKSAGGGISQNLHCAHPHVELANGGGAQGQSRGRAGQGSGSAAGQYQQEESELGAGKGEHVEPIRRDDGPNATVGEEGGSLLCRILQGVRYRGRQAGA